ncbi:MAG TPA: hypothetical protein VD963_01885, partial [Phycisphaerales bacterium]|nr:hypothetical protein [Phycisphaerales bacterium]
MTASHAALRSSRARAFSLALSLTVLTAGVVADDILQLETSSLTSYLGGTVPVQDVSPIALQRGVMLDGSRRAPSALAWAFAGQPQGEGWNAHRHLGGVDLAAGSYAPTDVDLALPGPGMSWVVGRTFNGVQESGGTHRDSNGLQGKNWFQLSQPAIVLYDADGNSGTEQDDDILYIVYGADRFLEFKRIADNSAEFKGKNGAAGAVKKTTGTPDTFTYTDQTGNQTVFFGFNTSGNTTNGQFWKLTDPAGNTLYVGDSSSASTAITNGYSSGRITTAYDAAANDGRRYTYTYTTVGSVSRLDRVKAEIKTGGTWANPTGVTEVAR